MAIRLAIIALACLTACGRIGYSIEQDPVGSGNGDVDAGQNDPGGADCTSFQPFDLQEADTSALDPALATFDTTCVGYCSLQTPMGLTHPVCLSPVPEFQEVVDEALQRLQPRGGLAFETGQVIDPGNVGSTGPLSPSNGAEALLAEMQQLTGSAMTGAWMFEAQTPCPNCTTFETFIVLWYRDTGWVMTLYGTHGYDS